MRPDVLLVQAERLRRERAGDSQLIHALGWWRDRAHDAVWGGDWSRAHAAFANLAAVCAELTCEEPGSGSADEV